MSRNQRGYQANNSRKRFRPAVGVTDAKLLPFQPPWIKRKKSRGRFAVGVRYEREVREHLALSALGVSGLDFREKQWVEFRDQNGRRWCEMDALAIDSTSKSVIVYEVKYQHCIEAWFQLRELYLPVAEKLFPGHTIGLMEIVHWHDPAVKFPQGYDFTDSPFRVPRSSAVSVFIFNPRRARSFRSRMAASGHNGGQGDGQAPGGSGLQEGTDRLDGASSSGGGGVVHEGSCEVPQGAEGKAQ